MSTNSSQMNEPTTKATEINKPLLRRHTTFIEPEPYKVGTSLAYSYVEPSKNFMEEEKPTKKVRIEEGKCCSFKCIVCLARSLNLEETKPNFYEKK